MKEFLKKIHLIRVFTIKLNIQKSEFVKTLQKHVDEGSTNFMTDIFDVFSSSKNDYKGHIGFNSFEIKRRKRFFDMNMNLATARGRYSQKDNSLIIETEINGFNGMMIPFYIMILVFYPVVITLIITDSNAQGTPIIAFPFLLIHASFMFGVPYFMMRRSAKNLAHELEREFYFITKDIVAPTSSNDYSS